MSTSYRTGLLVFSLNQIKGTLFQKPIESICKDDAEITAEIQSVVQHEIAHYFGIDDTKLDQIEKTKFDRKETTH